MKKSKDKLIKTVRQQEKLIYKHTQSIEEFKEESV